MQQRERAASAQFIEGSQDTKAKLLHRLNKMTPSELAKKNAECVRDPNKCLRRLGKLIYSVFQG